MPMSSAAALVRELVQASSELRVPAFCLVAATFAVAFARAVWSRRYLNDVPCPPAGSWFWGHEYLVFSNSAGAMYSQWFREFGSIVRMKGALMRHDILVIGDPAALTHIQQRRAHEFPHSESTRERIARFAGRSLGWVEGEDEHRRMRDLMAPALTLESVRNRASDVFDAVSRMQTALAEHLIDVNGVSNVNIASWTSAATMDIIGRFAFSHDFDGGNSKDAQMILQSWRQMATMAASPRAFGAMMLLRCFKFLNFVPLPALKAQANVRETIYAGVARELSRRSGDVKSIRGHDLLTLLLNARNEGRIPEQELLDHIVFIILSGSESSSQVIASCLWELAKQPELQQRLREEVTQIPNPTFEDLHGKMPYLDAVCKESLRLYPPIPYVERVAAEDDVLPLRHPITTPNGTVITELPIRKGQTVQIPMVAINRLGWLDGDRFRPDRWLEDMPPSYLLPTGWSHTLAFGDGPKSCAGIRLAVFEMKALLAALIRTFSFHDTGVDLDFKVSVSMQAFIRGKLEDGPQIPLTVKLL